MKFPAVSFTSVELFRSADRKGQSRQALTPSNESRRDLSADAHAIDGPGSDPDAPAYNHRGTVVVAGPWLAFYVSIVIHQLMASAN
jgi:hypothetical protein